MASTPISKIPAQASSDIEESDDDDDPEVLSILKEMSDSERPAPPPRQPTYKQPPPPPKAYPPPSANVVQHNLPKPYIQQDLLQKAVIASIIAAVMFYPKTLEILYTKFPIMEKFQSFDSIIRVGLLALVLYVLMWKLNL
jgi:hypothetical protein